MATETEVERLVVRLGGDGRGYKKMLVSAQAQTSAYTKTIGGRLRNAQGRFVAGQGSMTASLATTNGMLAKTRFLLASLATRLKAVGAAAIATGVKLRAFGRSMMMYVTAPLLIIAGMSASAFGSFDKAMVESTSIMKVTVAQTEKMREVALDLSTKAVQGPADLAKAYFYLASAGKNAEQSMALLPKVAAFATAGAFDMALATDLLTDAQSALGLSTRNVAQDTKNLTRVSDVLVKANTLANASVQQFATALTSKSGAALKAYGKSVEEGVAVLAALADQGVKAELAGNSLDRVIRLLSKGALDNAGAMEKYGVAVFDSAGKMRYMWEIIGDLERALGPLSDKERAAALDAMGFQARVQGVILPLLGTSKAIERYYTELKKAGGITEEVSGKQLKAFSNQMTIVWNNVKVMAISIGQTLVPWLETLGEKVKALTGWWNKLAPANKKIIVIVGLVVAAIGPLSLILSALSPAIALVTIGIGSLVGALAAMVTPVGAVIAAVATLGGYILFYTDAGAKALDWLGSKWDALVDHVRPAIQGITDAIAMGNWDLAFKIAWAQVHLTFVKAVRPLVETWAKFVFGLKVMWATAVNKIKSIWLTVVNAMAKGAIYVLGKIRGWSAEAVKGMQDVLDQMNKVGQASAGRTAADMIAGAFGDYSKDITAIETAVKMFEAKRDAYVKEAYFGRVIGDIEKIGKKGWDVLKGMWTKGMANLKIPTPDLPKVPSLKIPVRFTMDDSVMAGTAEAQRMLERQQLLFPQAQKGVAAPARGPKLGKPAEVAAAVADRKKMVGFLERLVKAAETGAKTTIIEAANLE